MANSIEEWIGSAIINLLAIVHFMYDKVTKELIVTIKMKWLNIAIILLSVVIMENSAEKAIHKMEQESRAK